MKNHTSKIYRILALVLALGSFMPCIFAQENKCNNACDQELLSSPKEGINMAYRCYDELRCEGQYSKDVNSNYKLLIKGFTRINGSWNPNLVDTLLLNWNSPNDKEIITIQASDLQKRKNFDYRMDTEQPIKLKKFYWPTQVLTSLELNEDEIGLIGKAQIMIGSDVFDVYIPLKIGHSNNIESNEAFYRLLIQPGIRLSEVSYSIYPINPEWTLENPVIFDQKHKWSSFSAEGIFEISFQIPKKDDFYKLKIAAKDNNGVDWTKDIIFYSSND